MGLSSSQARLLNLTARMHDIEYKAQNLEAQKLQMANESTQVYKEYEDALNKQKVQLKKIGSDGAASYVNATYNSLIEAGYKINFINGGEKVAFQTQTTKFLKAIDHIETQAEANALGYTCIYTATDLSNKLNLNPGGKYILMNDIDMTGESWTPINSFSGELNGNGYAIKNLTYSNNAYSDPAGMFKEIDGATIKNLGLVNIKISSSVAAHVGAIAGKSLNSTIENCYIDVQRAYGISCANDKGGFVGGNQGGLTIADSYITTSGSGSLATAVEPFVGTGHTPTITNSYYTFGTGATSYDDLPFVQEEILVVTNEQKNSTEWLSNMLQAGFIVLNKPMSDGTYTEVNIATDTSLQEVSDETELKKAEAKYEADMRKIDAKDKKFDTDLAAMETERNAIKTEMDTLKGVAKDNVDRTFKLFG